MPHSFIFTCMLFCAVTTYIHKPSPFCHCPLTNSISFFNKFHPIVISKQQYNTNDLYLFKWEWWRLHMEKVVISRCFISFSIDQMQNCCLLTHKQMGWRNAKKIAFVAIVNEESDSTFHNRIQWAFRPEFSLKKVSAITSQSVWNIWISSILHWMSFDKSIFQSVNGLQIQNNMYTTFFGKLSSMYFWDWDLWLLMTNDSKSQLFNAL